MSTSINDPVQNLDAVFLGWQENPEGAPVALYTITAADHPSYGSTVSEKTLRNFNLQVPVVPLLQEPFNKF